MNAYNIIHNIKKHADDVTRIGLNYICTTRTSTQAWEIVEKIGGRAKYGVYTSYLRLFDEQEAFDTGYIGEEDYSIVYKLGD